MNILCSCIRGNYNFYVKALDNKTLIYKDMSDWMEEAQYDQPTTYDVVVIPPGESIGKTFEFKVSEVNKITTDDFATIKDGVWCFQTVSCGVSYERSVGVFYSIECCIRKAYAQMPQNEEHIREVERYINAAKSAISIGKNNEAAEYLEIAQVKMNRLNCNCDC